MDDISYRDVTVDIGRATKAQIIPQSAGIPAENIRIEFAEQALGWAVHGVVEYLQAGYRDVEWRHTTKHVEGVWAAIVLLWLLPVFEWLRQRMIARGTWAGPYAEASFWQRRVLGALSWAEGHWTRRTEPYHERVPTHICPHVPIPERRQYHTRDHIDFLMYGPDSDHAQRIIAEQQRDECREAYEVLAGQHAMAMSHLDPDVKRRIRAYGRARSQQ